MRQNSTVKLFWDFAGPGISFQIPFKAWCLYQPLELPAKMSPEAVLWHSWFQGPMLLLLTGVWSCLDLLAPALLAQMGIKKESSAWWAPGAASGAWSSGDLSSLRVGLTEQSQQTGTYVMSCVFISEIICAISNELGYNLTGTAASTDCLFHCMTLSNFILFITPCSTYNNNVWAMTEQSF